MVTPDLLKTIIADQQEEAFPAYQIARRAEEKLRELAANREIIVITGVRRCGKSVLLQQVRRQQEQADYYFNFEDERLVTFSSDDFHVLHEVFIELFGVQNTFYFDEIQNIPGWELFVRRLYNSGYKIYITGSNATLFSEELGTRLTGRYISLAMYPYSFYESAIYKMPEAVHTPMRSTRQNGQIKKLFNQYCQEGGFPEYVKYQQVDYLRSLYESIIYRDIATRYKITNIKPLKDLVFYLASNCSKEMTYSSLRKLLQLGSTTTISDYCSYLENSYLCFFVNRYSESVKSQLQSPKKIYFIDHVLAKITGFHFSEDRGRLLENMVFIELKRRMLDIYYHREQKECDFIVRKNGRITQAIQVCAYLAEAKTKQREVAGLLEALARFSLTEGYILTESEEGTTVVEYENNHYTLKIRPVWKWLLEVDGASLDGT